MQNEIDTPINKLQIEELGQNLLQNDISLQNEIDTPINKLQIEELGQNLLQNDISLQNTPDNHTPTTAHTCPTHKATTDTTQIIK